MPGLWWQLRIASEMLQVESAGAVKAVYTEQTLCKFTPERVLCTHSLWIKFMKGSCPWVITVHPSVPCAGHTCPGCCPSIQSARQNHWGTLKTQKCPHVAISWTPHGTGLENNSAIAWYFPKHCDRYWLRSLCVGPAWDCKRSLLCKMKSLCFLT